MNWVGRWLVILTLLALVAVLLTLWFLNLHIHFSGSTFYLCLIIIFVALVVKLLNEIALYKDLGPLYWVSKNVETKVSVYDPRKEYYASLLTLASGPSPWYWQNPVLWKNLAYRQQALKLENRNQSRSYYVTAGNDVLLVIDFHVLFQDIGNNTILLWHFDEVKQELVFHTFCFDKAEPVMDLEKANAAIASKQYVYAENMELVARINTSDLSRKEPTYGNVALNIPHTVHEVMFVFNMDKRTSEKGDLQQIYALMILDIENKRFKSIPLLWFNESPRDYGYEWLSQAIRDPESKKILISGIRVEGSILDSSGEVREEVITFSGVKKVNTGEKTNLFD